MKRLGRIWRALFPRKPDDAWALAYLQPEEISLYLRMDLRDRAHGLEVAQALLSRYPEAPEYVIRAALLHDLGKSLRPYRLLERIMTSLYTPPVPVEPLRGGWVGAWQIRRHHPLYGAQRIKAQDVAALVLEHHAPKSLWALRIHEIDQEF
jgi:hypothetical protein